MVRAGTGGSKWSANELAGQLGVLDVGLGTGNVAQVVRLCLARGLKLLRVPDVMISRPQWLRAALGRRRRDMVWIWGLRGLQLRVVLFQWRARRLARRIGDHFSLISVTRPVNMRALVELAS